MAQVGIYEALPPGSLQAHHHNSASDGDFLYWDSRAFGIFPNSGQDETSRVQAAFGSLTSGGSIFFPAGQYNVGLIQPLSNTHIFGSGHGTIFYLINGKESHLFHAQSKSGIILENILFDGNKAGQAGATFHVVRFEGCSNCLVRNVYIQNGSYANLTFKDSSSCHAQHVWSKNPKCVGFYLANSLYCTLTSIDHESNSGGVSGYHGILLYNGSRKNKIAFFTFRASVDLIMGIGITVGSHENKISHADFIAAANAVEISDSNDNFLEYLLYDKGGVSLSTESFIQIINSLRTKVAHARAYQPPAHGIYNSNGSHDTVYDDISIEGAEWSGFSTDGSERCQYTNCKAIANKGRGFYILNSAHRTSLFGCHGVNNGQGGAAAGVEIASSNNCNIDDGFFYDDQGTKTQSYGIQETGTTNFTTISSVRVTPNLTGTIALAGASSYVEGYSINVQALSYSPADAETVYFGSSPRAPTATAATSKTYIRRPGLIRRAEIYCYSGTAGSNESWSLYIRLNNTTDYLIQTVGAATNERIFTNSNLAIPVVSGDYLEIKAVAPTWGTNPATTTFGGTVFIEGN